MGVFISIYEYDSMDKYREIPMNANQIAFIR